jgi:hypothetical protein
MIITKKHFEKFNKNLLKDDSINEFIPIDIINLYSIQDIFYNYFKELISIYLDTQKNKQIMFDINNNVIYTSNSLSVNYIDKILSIGFISFILELFNFYIIHCKIIPIQALKDVNIIKNSINFNTTDNKTLNNLLSINNKPKIYNEKLVSDLKLGFYPIIQNFYNNINISFNKFMNNFINNIFTKYNTNIPITIDDIENCFISKQEKNYSINNKFLIIYDNWKDNLNKLLKINNNDIIDILYKCLIEISDTKTKYDLTEYGFFSMIYGENTNNNCFTYTFIEQYILLKLYFNPYQINILLQNHNNDMSNNINYNISNIIYYTNLGLYNKYNINLINFSHWGSEFKVYNINNLPLSLQHGPTGHKIKTYKLRITNKNYNNSLSIVFSKEFYFKCLIYIIIDININYINKNKLETNNLSRMSIKDAHSTTILNVILNKFFNLFETELNYNLDKNNNYNSYKIYELINKYKNDEDEYNTIKDNIDLINNNDCNDIVKMITDIDKKSYQIIDKYDNIKLYFDSNNVMVVSETEVYKSISTKFINDYFYSTPKTSYNFYKLINTTFTKSLEIYCKNKKIDTKSIIFIFKGGNILRIIVEQLLENNFNNYELSELIKLKNNNYKRSDSDFQIYIRDLIDTKFIDTDIKITKDDMDNIHNDISNLSYLLLNRIRNIILLDISKYIYFFQLNKKIQLDLLNNLLKDLNDVNTDFKFTCLKFEDLTVGDIDLNNYPFTTKEIDKDFINNIDTYNNINSRNDFGVIKVSKENECIIYKNIKDVKPLEPGHNRIFLANIDYIHNKSEYVDNIDSYIEKKLIYKNRNKTNFYITYNNTLDVIKNNDSFKFNLIRMKLNITSYFLKKYEDDKLYTNILNIPGEFIDIVVARYDNKITKEFFSEIDKGEELISDYNITSENEETIAIKSYSLKYFIKDLEIMLFFDTKLPWENTKYNKRLERLLLLYIVMFIESYIKNDKVDKFNIYSNKISIYKKLLPDVIIENTILSIYQKTIDNLDNDQKELFDNLFKIYIYKINLNIEINDYSELLKFYGIINKYIDILEQLLIKINKKQFIIPMDLQYHGGDSKFYDKYLKYKLKYINLHKKIY